MENGVGDLLDGSGHSVLGVYGADDRGPSLVTAVVLNANALDVGDNDEILPYLFSKAALIKLVAEDSISLAQSFKTVAGDSAKASYAESVTGDRLTLYHCVRKTKRFTDNSYFILIEKLDGLNEFEVKILGKSTNVVV